MSQVRSKDTQCELKLRQALRNLGLSGYRLHVKGLPGTPDIVFPRYKVAVFCDSDFWHGRTSLPKSNREYWEKKLRGNMERDLKNNAALRDRGWTVARFSESDILRDPNGPAQQVQTLLSKRD